MKKLICLVLAMVVILSLAACGATENPDETKDQNIGQSSEPGSTVYDIKVSGHPYLHALASVRAVEKGYFKCADPEIDLYAGGPVQNEAIASGAWDVGTTGTGGLVLGAVGYDVKCIGFSVPGENTTDLWVRADSEIASKEPDEKGVRGTADDWKGKTILCATGTDCHMMLIGMLKHLGLTEDDINLIDTSVADSYAAFKAGTADAVALWSPFGFQAEEDTDWVKVCSAANLGLSMPNAIIATEEAIKNDWDGVYAYLKAYLKAAEELNADPEGTAETLYNFSEEQGIALSESAAVQEVKNRPFATAERNVELMKVRQDGGCEANDILLEFAAFFEGQGKISKDDLAKLQENGLVDTSFMEAYAAGK